MIAWYPAVVAGSTEGFGAGDTEYSAEHFVAGAAGAENAGNSGVGVGVCFGAAFLVGFVNFHPSLPLCSSSLLQRGQCGPHVQFFAACLGATLTLGIAAT